MIRRQHRLKGPPAAIVTWYSRFFKRKRHNTFEQILGNGNVSLLRPARSYLAMNRKDSLCDYCRCATNGAATYSLFSKSHGHHTQSHASHVGHVLCKQIWLPRGQIFKPVSSFLTRTDVHRKGQDAHGSEAMALCFPAVASFCHQ